MRRPIREPDQGAMAKSSPSDTPSLADLRREIDRIDEAMHGLLIERSEIINRLIKVKKTQEKGSAFRPAREADMMRRLVDRHKGILPLDTVESIWRVIIATFTYVQSPFSSMPTSRRAPRRCAIPPGFISASRCRSWPIWGLPRWSPRCRNRPAISAWCRPSAVPGAGAWWNALEFDSAPKIIARLPFVERDDHPAALPVFVLSRIADDAMVTEVEVWSMRVAGWSAAAAEALGPLAEVVAVPDQAFDGAALLISVPQGGSIAAITDALIKAGATVRASARVGSHATRYRVSAQGARPVATGR